MSSNNGHYRRSVTGSVKYNSEAETTKNYLSQL